MPNTPLIWKTSADAERIKLYDQHQSIYKGDFLKVWRDLKPIDSGFIVSMNDGATIVDAITNLLFREKIDLLAKNQDPNTQHAIDELVERNQLHALFKEQGTWTAIKGDGVFLVRAEEGKAVVEDVDPRYFFGEFDPLNASKLVKARLAYPISHDSKLYVYQQIHEVIEGQGVIRHQLFLAEEDDFTGEGKLIERVPLETLPQFAGLERIETTGIDEILITHVKNRRCPGDPYGLSGYTTSLKQKFKARTQLATQRRSVTAKHMEPIITMPKEVLRALKEQAGDKMTIKKESLKLIGLAPNQEGPKAMSWDAQLQYAIDEDAILLRQILEEAKISPALLGASSGGIDGGETGRAGLMKIQVSLGLANSKQQLWEPGIKSILRKAMKLEQSVGDDPFEMSDVNVVWKDGLFSDGITDAQKEQILMDAGLSSRESAIMRLTGWTVDKVKEEMDKIDADEHALERKADPFAGN